jgi:vacuolar-type H+-ATPase subunit D/Vma8
VILGTFSCFDKSLFYHKKSADVKLRLQIFFCSYQIQESSKSAQLRVRAKQENVSGVMLPAFEMYNEGGNGKVLFRVCVLFC